MIETITYKGKQYPKFQTEGYASRYAIPYAQRVCNGVGVDIGCNREEWAFPGSTHCLEHLTDWVSVLDYWKTKLKPGGVLFLYLPDYSQVYWRPWNNRKHMNIFSPQIIRDYMEDRGYKNVFTSCVDLYNAFMVFGENV